MATTKVPVPTRAPQFDTDLASARKYVDGKVTDGSFGRATNTYLPQATELAAHEKELTRGYDSSTMQPTMQQNQASLEGATRAFAGKMSNGGGGFQPYAQNAQQLYTTGTTADNYGVKQAALKQYGNTLQGNTAHDLAFDQGNLDRMRGEHSLRASLPFDILNGISALRTGRRGTQTANSIASTLGGK